MKKFLIIALLLFCSNAYALDVIPKYVGNLSTDTIKIPIVVNDIDTVQIYEAMNLAGGDKIIIHRYDPSNTRFTADTNTVAIVKLQNGIYEARYRASNSAGDLGAYRVVVEVYFKGKIRGGEALTYYVMSKGLHRYLADIEDQGWYSGSIMGAKQVWWTVLVGGRYVTDSIVVYDSLNNRKRVIKYSRTPGTAVITETNTDDN